MLLELPGLLLARGRFHGIEVLSPAKHFLQTAHVIVIRSDYTLVTE